MVDRIENGMEIMVEVKFYDNVADELLKFAIFVIVY